MPHVEDNETLSNLISLAIDNENHILVESSGKAVGVITRSDILRIVVEGTEMS
jgi:glycine betaine/proline transport system ATP-binding protein